MESASVVQKIGRIRIGWAATQRVRSSPSGRLGFYRSANRRQAHGVGGDQPWGDGLAYRQATGDQHENDLRHDLRKSSDGPDLAFCMVDVRDVARVHVTALDALKQQESGSSLPARSRSSDALAQTLKEAGFDKVATRKAPSLLLRLMAPSIKMKGWLVSQASEG